ncbi:MAG: hypothetical protein AAB448_04345 [Patescibacteria group bacterium]
MKKDALLLGGLLFLGVCVLAFAIFAGFFLSDSPVPREELPRSEDLSPPSHLEDSDDSPITKDPKDLDGPLVTGDPSVSWPIIFQP